MSAKQQAQQLINKAMTMKSFSVTRLEHEVVFNGIIPFNIKHRMGSPYIITVCALSQMEAEQKVDAWQEGML